MKKLIIILFITIFFSACASKDVNSCPYANSKASCSTGCQKLCKANKEWKNKQCPQKNCPYRQNKQ